MMDSLRSKLTRAARHTAACWRPVTDARGLVGDGGGDGDAAPPTKLAESARDVAVPAPRGAGRIKVLTGVRALALL